MPTLYVLRHAKSDWGTDVHDHERPLNARGLRACAALAAHLTHERIHPDLVLCSSAQRTRETLDHVYTALGSPRTLIDPAFYLAPAERWLHAVRQLGDTADSVLLVGHNPGCEDLVDLLAPDVRGAAKFPTGAFATLETPGDDWDDLAPGAALLGGILVPADLGVR